MDDDYRIIHVREHYEAYINGEFYCSADTYNEAECEVNDNERYMQPLYQQEAMLYL